MFKRRTLLAESCW